MASQRATKFSRGDCAAVDRTPRRNVYQLAVSSLQGRGGIVTDRKGLVAHEIEVSIGGVQTNSGDRIRKEVSGWCGSTQHGIAGCIRGDVSAGMSHVVRAFTGCGI